MLKIINMLKIIKPILLQFFYILREIYVLHRYLFILIQITIFKVLALITLRGDLDATLECIPPLIVDCVCIVKMVNLLCNIEKVCM